MTQTDSKSFYAISIFFLLGGYGYALISDDFSDHCWSNKRFTPNNRYEKLRNINKKESRKRYVLQKNKVNFTCQSKVFRLIFT